MKGRTLLLAALMILSVAVGGIGSASATGTADSVEPTQQTNVSAQDSSTDIRQNTLTIVGTGSEAQYTFSVTDDLQKDETPDANINKNDEIRHGYVGDGEVGVSADSYTFSGQLETIKLTGDVEVYLNGQRLSDSAVAEKPDNVIEFEGIGEPTQYSFAAEDTSEPVQKLTANNSNVNSNDDIYRTTGNGEVGISKDTYGFEGKIAALSRNGGGNIYVNGQKKSVVVEGEHVITIVGKDDPAEYQFTDGSNLAKSTANFANTNSNDRVTAATATGEVGISSDSYIYDGTIVEFTAQDVTVYIDGERVQQGSIGN